MEDSIFVPVRCRGRQLDPRRRLAQRQAFTLVFPSISPLGAESAVRKRLLRWMLRLRASL